MVWKDLAHVNSDCTPTETSLEGWDDVLQKQLDLIGYKSEVTPVTREAWKAHQAARKTPKKGAKEDRGEKVDQEVPGLSGS